MKSNMQLQREADAPLFEDVERASIELERRLLESVQPQDGLLIVREPFVGQFYTYVLPPNSPWVISCGIGGLSIVLGNSVGGGELTSGVSNEIELHLTYGKIEQKNCAILAPRIGKRLKAMFRDDQSPNH
jgi:hypothetical protein